MCGIAGYLDPNLSEKDGVALLNRMNQSIEHRGPDGLGHWLDAQKGVGLGHTRLSIVGLGEVGHQPMVSSQGRYVISFNGEIYNFRDLKSELVDFGCHFRGGSDTEVLLAAIETWGLDETLEKIHGMFAFALVDQQLDELSLVRDRLGEKPLYVGERADGHVAFSSDLRTLFYQVDPEKAINRNAVKTLLSLNYIPSPETIFTGVSKLEPANLWKFRLEHGSWNCFTKKRWWSRKANGVFNSKNSNICKKQATSELIAILEQVIYEQGDADVPVGSFLSGGIDSTLVTAIHQQVSGKNIKTFTATFDEKEFDEGPQALEVANWLGTDHREIRVSVEQAQEIILSMPHVFSEPFADSSQIATLAICRGAAKELSAVLTGDGGDEIFGGYNRYIWAPRLWNLKTRLPKVSNRVSELIEGSLSSRIGRFLARQVQNTVDIPQLEQKIMKIGWALRAATKQKVYQSLISNPEIGEVVIAAPSAENRLAKKYELSGEENFAHAMMSVDLKTYFPEDILVKVDRAAMSVGLETRLPLVDSRVVSYMNNVPKRFFIDSGQSKILLRNALHAYVPKKIIEKPKKGFAVPIGSWLRGELRLWASELLSQENLRSLGIFDVDLVTKCWLEHLSGSKDHYRQLWPLLMFQSWIAHVMDDRD